MNNSLSQKIHFTEMGEQEYFFRYAWLHSFNNNRIMKIFTALNGLKDLPIPAQRLSAILLENCFR